MRTRADRIIRAIPTIRAIRAIRIFPFLICVAASVLVLVGQPRKIYGDPPIVERLILRAEEPLDRPTDLWSLIEIQAGQPLDRKKIARTVLNIHALGIASEVEVYSKPLEDLGGGVAVTVVLWATDRVREVRLVGNLGLKRAKLENVLLQRSSEPLLEDRIVRGVYRLKDLYVAQGYLDHEVRLELEDVPGRREQDVVYRVESGAPYEIGEVRFEGELNSVQPAELLEELKAEPGSRYRQDVILDDVERLERELLDRGFRLASVQPPQEFIDHLANQVGLAYPVSLGPRFEIQVVGADLEELSKSGLLPFYATERYDIALVLQAVELLKRHYQEKGHYQVKVGWDEERTEDLLRLGLEIDLGPKMDIGSLRFRGNEEFDSAQLAALCATSVRHRFTPGSGRLMDETLRLDLANIRSFYALNGFDRAVVGPAEIEESGGELQVVIPVLEGSRRRIADLQLSGVSSLERDLVLAATDLLPAGPFHEFLIEEARDRIRALYAASGFGATRVIAEYEWNEDDTLVNVVIKVDEGPRSVIDRIILRGNRKTDSALIRRAMRVEADEPLSAARLLEIQRNLYDLGIFSSVQVQPAPGTVYSSYRDLVVRVEEGRTRRILQGVGFDSEDGLRGLLGYSQSNLFGQAVTGRIDLKASQREEQVRALLRQPYLGRWEIPVTYSLFRIEEEKDAFQSRRRGGQIDMKRFGANLRLGLLYTFKLVEVPAGDVPADERELSEARISSITPSLLIDRRDDPLDPSSGWSSNFVLEYAFPLLSAETRFLKFFGQQTAYADLDRFGVVAGSLRLGVLEPLEIKSSQAGVISRPSEIPISELFFAGGRTTHRAYRRDRLGVLGESLILEDGDDPLDDGALPTLVPLGGTGLVIANLDYRFPIFGALGGSLFADAGNVWADWRDFDPSEMKVGLGLGVRYRSPIGPLRLEVGWKLDREIGEDAYVVLLSFGNPF